MHSRDRRLRVLRSLLVGAIVAVVVGLGVTAALDPYVWPSLLMGIPTGLVAGVAAGTLAFRGVGSRERSGRS
jgi:hypothetical protein